MCVHNLLYCALCVHTYVRTPKLNRIAFFFKILSLYWAIGQTKKNVVECFSNRLSRNEIKFSNLEFLFWDFDVCFALFFEIYFLARMLNNHYSTLLLRFNSFYTKKCDAKFCCFFFSKMPYLTMMEWFSFCVYGLRLRLTRRIFTLKLGNIRRSKFYSLICPRKCFPNLLLVDRSLLKRLICTVRHTIVEIYSFTW